MSALFFVGYCVGNIIGPQTFRAADAPHYVPAEITIIVLLAACILDMVAMYLHFRWRNKQKVHVRSATGYQKLLGGEFWDLTDGECWKDWLAGNTR